MTALTDLIPNALVAVTFLSLGTVKIYGWRRGVIGGGGKPLACRLMGRCPSWSKPINIGVIVLFLTVGVLNLGFLTMALLKKE
jgi:hypothetical protein